MNQNTLNTDACKDAIAKCFENFDLSQYQIHCACMSDAYPDPTNMCNCLDTISDHYYYTLCGCAFL